METDQSSDNCFSDYSGDRNCIFDSDVCRKKNLRSMGNHSRRKTGRTISTWQNGTWKESKMQLERSD